MSLADLRKRLPVRVRQHWMALTAGLTGVALALTAFGGVTIRPYSTSSAAVTDEERITQDVRGTVSLFDGSAAHAITLSYAQDDYDRMLDAYFSDGAKEWMVADVTIDGTTVDSVGIRLKGNSTLSGLADDRAGSQTQGQRAGRAGGVRPGDGGGGRQDGRGPGVRGDGWAGGSGALSTQEPENLPLLVSFDKYQPGRAYQHVTEIAIRPASRTYRSSLNEAVALELTARSGQPTQAHAFTTYTVNDRPTTTRLVVENPDPQYAAGLDGDGVLYKVLAGSSFAYQGEDQTSYTDDFHQVNLKGSQDLQPIVSFLRWLQEASDEEFRAELDDWVDVSALARYLGTQEVLENFDTIAGPGRNGYLYYDLDTHLISVVAWDANLAFGGMSMGRGGGGFGGGFGGRSQSNRLVTRFQDDPQLSKLVDDAASSLRASWIDGGQAAQVVDQLVRQVPATDGLPQATIDADDQALRAALSG